MAATVLLKLASFTNDLRTIDIAHHALAQVQPMMAQYPLGFGQWLQALSYALSKTREIAIVGDPNSADTQALLSVVRDEYRPFQVVALGAPDAQPPAAPLLQDRGLVDGRPAAYTRRSTMLASIMPNITALHYALPCDRVAWLIHQQGSKTACLMSRA